MKRLCIEVSEITAFGLGNTLEDYLDYLDNFMDIFLENVFERFCLGHIENFSKLFQFSQKNGFHCTDYD